jgi:predicted dehydrogenase
MKRKLRMGMVGGGRGAFIGAVHRMAANLDGKIELVAGAFSSDPGKSKLSGEDFFLDAGRVYGSYAEMAEKEAAREDKIDFVTIVVQNHLHFAVAKTFLEAGFNVICDKPMTLTLEQGLELREIVAKSGKVFCLTHNYTGYPMVKEARRMVRDGELGRLLKVVAEYPQGYAVGDVEGEGQGKISNWRADPKVAGASNCMGDIGTHAHNLVRYITGLEIEEIAAELTAFIPGRELDDDGNCLVRFTGGVKGLIFASQISNGDENALSIRAYGTKASIEWHQEDPNELIVKYANAPRKT